MKRALTALLVVAAGAVLVWGLRPRPVASRGASGGLPGDVLLISIDTLRADHLGCYGYGKPTTPHIDRFREDAVLFTQAISQAPSTLPSHASIFTSLLPQQHGASAAGEKIALPAGVPTLAEVLRRRRALTVSFNEGGQVGAEFGLDRGFALYRSSYRYRFFDIVDRVIAWLDGNAPRSLFLFLHTYETHHPYKPEPRYLAMIEPDGYSGPLPPEATYMATLIAINEGKLHVEKRDLEHVVSTYDAEIRSMDDAFGRLVDYLKSTGRYDRTTIVFTSDHGEEFGEHATVGWHSHTLYDELLHVPLLIKYPGAEHAGAVVTVQVRSIDIAPTILGIVGLAVPVAFRGSDLTPLVEGRPEPPRFAVSKRDGSPSVSIRTPQWKLLDGRLFDLERDPGEKVDIAKDRPDLAERLRLRRDALVAERPALAGRPIEITAEERARLLALGYVN